MTVRPSQDLHVSLVTTYVADSEREVGRGDAGALLPGHGEPQPGPPARSTQVSAGPQVVYFFFILSHLHIFREMGKMSH